MNNNQSISFTTDILKSVSEKHEIPLSVVKYSFDIMLRNLESLIKNSNASSISVPEIGTIYASYKMLTSVRNKMYENKEDVSFINVKIKDIEDLIEKNKLNKNYRTNRHLQRKFIRNHFFSKGLTVQEIEDKQNETRE